MEVLHICCNVGFLDTYALIPRTFGSWELGMYIRQSTHHCVTSITCTQARNWTNNLAFVVAFGTLFAKIWRLYRIFANKTLTKRVSVALAM